MNISKQTGLKVHGGLPSTWTEYGPLGRVQLALILQLFQTL